MKKLKLKKQSKPRNLLIPIIALVAIVIIVALVIGFFVIKDQDGKLLNHIAIKAMPEKTFYYVGDNADFTGLKINAIFNNGESQEIAISDCIITGFDSSQPNENLKIRVAYQGMSVTFSVIIQEIPQSTPLVTRIYLEKLPKTEYRLGEYLDTNEGIIVCEYQDGSTKRIPLEYNDVSGFSKISAPGTYELTVKYKENGIVVYTTYTITVTE